MCQDPNCSSWTDGGTDFCWYHAAQRGIHPEEQTKDPALCHAPECTRPIHDDDLALCDYHAWDARHALEVP